MSKNYVETIARKVPYIWDPDTFSQSDRGWPSENVAEIEIAPEVSQFQDHSGHKNLIRYQKCLIMFLHPSHLLKCTLDPLGFI